MLHRARRLGVPTPAVLDIDLGSLTLTLRSVGEVDLRDRLTEGAVEAVGRHLATLHSQWGVVHGDPTVRNVRVDDDRVYLIDFGLGFRSDDLEDWAMDLHIVLQSLQDVTDDIEPFREALLRGYGAADGEAVEAQLDEIEGRGRYR